MKTNYLIILGLFLAGSCAPPKYYQLRINDIPTKSPNYNAEIRFIKDSLPVRPYFEVVDIDLLEKGNLTEKEIRRLLEIEAMKEGVDAIVWVENWGETTEQVNLFSVLVDVMDDDNEPTTFPKNFTHIRGRGIMYVENLDFIHEQPEYEYFYQVNLETDFPQPFFKVEYKLTGQVYMVYPESDEALDVFKKYIQNYTDFHLLKQRAGWSYKKDGNLLTKRILRMESGYITKICIPVYDKKNRMISLKIIHQNSAIDTNEVIHYSYDSIGKLSGRIIECYDGTRIYEEYQYEYNQLISRTVFINMSQQKQVKLHTSFHYYDPNYLKDFYFNEVADKNNK